MNNVILKKIVYDINLSNRSLIFKISKVYCGVSINGFSDQNNL